MAKIEHIYYALPERTVTNADLVKEFPDTTEENIFKRTGVKSRHIYPYTTYIASDIAAKTCNEFFAKTNFDKSKIDFVIFCSSVLDHLTPSTAGILQHKLGLKKGIGAMDIPFGCSGYVYSLATAKSFIQTGLASTVLLVAQEYMSTIIYPDNLELRSLFGDASTCSVITQSETGIGEFILGTDGEGEHNLTVSKTCKNNQLDEEILKVYEEYKWLPSGKLDMNGPEIFSFTLNVIPDLVRNTVVKNGLTMDEIDLFIFHQANGFMLDVVRRKMNIEKERFFMHIAEVGNTASATIPVCITEALKQGKIKKGSKVLITGFGIGYSWGATVITF